TVAQTNFLVWIRHWLPGLLKSRKKNILPAKTEHTRTYRKMWIPLKIPYNRSR
ncbi:exonuclease, partial [Escherichia coli]